MINEPPISSTLPVMRNMATWPRPWANWLSQAWVILFAAQESGVSADRPTVNLWVGRQFFDTTIGMPIYYDGSAWVKADGTAA